METTTGNPGGVPPAPPATDGAAVAAETADLLRRYLSGGDLTAREFGLVGKHYKSVGKPVPKEQRKAVLEKTRVGTSVAAAALLADNPPTLDPVSSLAPPPPPSADNLELLRTTVRSALGTAGKFLEKKALRVAKKYQADDQTRREIVADATVTPEDVDLILNPLPAIAAKYGVPLDYLPEAALAAGVTNLGVKWASLFSKLDDMERAFDEREKARGKVPEPMP